VKSVTGVFAAALEARPGLEVALCLEEPALWQAIGRTVSLGRCNCRL
jgi:hypothetical protein